MCCKVRGFTLNYKNSKKINFERMVSLVRNMDREEKIAINNPCKITRDVKRRKVINKEETKMYKIVYEKRVIQEDLTTLPYGY
ncbi:unnamed protein product [Larinioides sclopetarius]|uniref:Uncharacterized protein n=1 Tax=Larinioides sclopetarius TaxID=280406 RepID=A0AAV2AGK0_9ARAC